MRWLGPLALSVVAFSAGRCIGGDPKIFEVKWSEADISKQIDPERQGVGTRLPRRTLGCERLRSMVWRRTNCAALPADGADVWILPNRDNGLNRLPPVNCHLTSPE
jgi:hypothetical protein